MSLKLFNKEAIRALAKELLVRSPTERHVASVLREKLGWTGSRRQILNRYFNGKQLPVSRNIDPKADTFLQSYEWRRVRMEVLKRDGARCCCCGATPADGMAMHVDHIKPRRIYPQLALDANNLQVLCGVCNHGKGNWDMTDWRNKNVPVELTLDQLSHMKNL